MGRHATLALCRAATVLALAASCGGGVRRVTPPPAAAALPNDTIELILKTALADTLREPREFIHPPRGKLLLLRDGPRVSDRILPSDTGRPISIASAEQIEALATQAGTIPYYYLQVRLVAAGPDEAVVKLQLFPALRKGEIAMCCWTIDRRYVRTETGWRFDRLVDEGVY